MKRPIITTTPTTVTLDGASIIAEQIFELCLEELAKGNEDPAVRAEMAKQWGKLSEEQRGRMRELSIRLGPSTSVWSGDGKIYRIKRVSE